METKWKCINLRLDFIRLQGIDAWKLRFNTSNSHVSTLARRNQWPSRIADVKHELLVTWTVRELQMILFSGKWVPKNDSFLVHRVMFHFNDFGRKGGIYIMNILSFGRVFDDCHADHLAAAFGNQGESHYTSMPYHPSNLANVFSYYASNFPQCLHNCQYPTADLEI